MNKNNRIGRKKKDFIRVNPCESVVKKRVFMKKLFNILCASILALGLAFPAGAANESLAKMEFNIVGVGVEASPGYQAVPKGINTQVDTAFVSPAFELTEDVLSQLPSDYEIKAELSGPGLQTPKSLTTRPGQPFDIQILTALGKYTLSNIRLVDGTGKVLFAANPQAVTIESIADPIVTQVITRELSVEELIERGVTFDSSNFTAYEFTAGIATESGQIPISLPVIIPEEIEFPNPEDIPAPINLSIVPPTVTYKAPEEEDNKIKVPRNLTVAPFIMSVPEAFGDEKIELPPIPGIVVIPGNIGFLHQYFSAVVMVTNGAPGESDLVVKNLKATIRFPSGEDKVAGTDAEPGDDPIRMAKGGDEFFPRILPIMHPGVDGKQGTDDDVSLMHPAETGQADFTIEGLKEGTHRLDFDITATLEGLPIGPVQITGKATGAVLVRNPDFTLTFGHPATVRTGERYDLYITVTNTGKSAANLVSLHLNPRALSGAAFAEGEEPDKLIEIIPAGTSETIKFSLVSQLTGAVTANAFESESVKGRFNLRTGVGDDGIPLSPDSLILPYTDGLSADLIDSAVGLLGQAWSVATAPSGALPADVTYITKKHITNRAYDLSEAGLRVLIGDTMAKAIEDMTFDFFGSDKADIGFDELRRRSGQGLKMNYALANIFRDEVLETGALSFQTGFAEKVSYRPGHISVITSDAPIGVQLSDGSGLRTGGLAADENLREIPYSDQFIMVPDEGSISRGTLTVVTKIDSADYRAYVNAWGDATFDMGIVLPDASGTLRQVSFSGITMPSGAKGWVTLLPGTNSAYTFNIDSDGDGAADSEVAGSTLVIPDTPPHIVAATQLVPDFGPGGDKHGRNVGVLFSERVTKESAQDALNYLIGENLVKQVSMQPGGRMVFMLLRDGIGPFVERDLIVSNLVDTADNVMEAPETLPIRITAEGPAALVKGHVRMANGEPVAGASVRMMQLVWYDDGYTIEARYAIFSEKMSEEDGSFQFEYVLQNGDPAGPFMLEVTHAETGERGQLTQGVSYHGEVLTLDVFMKARGSVTGTVSDGSGNPVSGADVLINTLNDKRFYSAKSDGTGGFSFSGLSAGAYSIKVVNQASLSEGMVMGIISDDGGEHTQDVTIYPVADFALGDVSGKVIGFDGTPRKGIVVEIEGYKYRNWMYSGEDGSFAFTDVYAGNHIIKASDYQTGEESRVKVIVNDGSTTSASIVLTGTAGLSGLIAREDSKPLDGIYVVARMGTIQKMTQTDASGAFSFEGFPMGNVNVNVIDPYDFNKTVASGSVSLITPGETADIYFFIPAKAMESASIKGTVYKRDGTVWPFAEVRRILDSWTYEVYSADSLGNYEIPNLRIKTHQLVTVGVHGVCNSSIRLWYDTQVATVNLRPAPTGTVKGVTYDDAEMTIPTGAKVSFSSMKPNLVGWLAYPQIPDRIQSDPDTGEFTFTNVYMGNFSVKANNVFRPTAVSASGTISSAGQVVHVVLPLKGEVKADGTVVNQPGSVSGQVFMPDGSPVGEGVRVSITAYGGAEITVTTDAEGKYQFSPIISAGGKAITAEDPVTTLQWKGSVYVRSGLDVPLNITLLGRGSIKINAFYADGSPAPDTEIIIKGSDFPNDEATVITGAEGTITANNLTEGKYAISAMGSFGRGGRAEGVISKDGENVNVNITLAPSGTVTGIFYKADGVTPISGGQIRLVKSGKTIAYATSSSGADDTGRFVMEYIPLGNYGLSGFDPISERWGGGGGRLNFDGDTSTANVRITPIGTVEGVVLNYGGTDIIANAGISITAGGYKYSSVTNPDGSFIFAGVPAGSFSLRATDPTNKLVGEMTGKISYEGEILFVQVNIPPTGSISGTVYMPDGITPVLSAEINLSSIGQTTVDASGSFSFTNLPTGRRYSLSVNENGTNRKASKSITIENDGDNASGDMILRGIGTVEGTVYHPDGTPLAGAKVAISGSGAYYADYTDSNGHYSFSGIPVGSINLSANHSLLSTASSASGTLNGEGAVLTLDMTFGDIATVRGVILLPDGLTPAEGIGVVFSGCYKQFTIATGADGAFNFGNLPIPCNYNLYAENGSATAIAKASGSLTFNGEVHDLGGLALDDQPVRVQSVNPEAGTIDVPVNPQLDVTFTEPVDPSSVTATNIYINKGNQKITSSMTLGSDRKSVVIKPETSLEGETLYNIVITTGVRDLVGRPLPQTYRSSFTTLDNTVPDMATVVPADGAIEIAANSTINISFTESIDPNYLDGITLLSGGGAVAANVVLTDVNRTAVLTPIAPLPTNMQYTVVVSNVRDVAGNIMTGSRFSFFNTLDSVPPVIISFSVPEGVAPILGGTVRVTAEVGGDDVSLVDFFVDGVLRGTDKTAPYGFNLPLEVEGSVTVTAIAMDRVGNRSAEAVLSFDVNPNMPPTVEITYPGVNASLYQDSQYNVQVTASDDVALSEIIFTASGAVSSTQTKTIGGGKSFSTSFKLVVPKVLSHGSEIILSAVAVDSMGMESSPFSITVHSLDVIMPRVSLASTGETVRFKPGEEGTVNITASDNDAISRISCSASGAATGSMDVTFDDPARSISEECTFMVDADANPDDDIYMSCTAWDVGSNSYREDMTIYVADTVSPQVTGSSIAEGATEISATASVSVSFNEPLSSPTVNVNTLIMSANDSAGTVVAGDVSISGDRKMVTFNPSSKLAPATAYTLTVTSAVADESGNELASDFQLRFTTDATPPAVTGSSIFDGATDIGITPTINVSFSEALAASTVSTSTVTMSIDDLPGGSVAGSVSLSSDGRKITFTPASRLARATAYKVTIADSVTDVAGNSLTASYLLRFTTDATAPTVTGSSISDGATGITVTPTINISFSEALASTSVSNATVLLSSDGTGEGVAVSVVISGDSNTITVLPSSALAPAMTYRLTVTGDVTDIAGNGLTAAYLLRFTTDATPPAVTGSSISDGATGITVTPKINVSFSEALAASTVNEASVTMSIDDAAGGSVAGSVTLSNDGKRVTFTPSSRLASATAYKITIADGVTDVAGNALTAPYLLSFTTDGAAPQILSITPVDGAPDAFVGNGVVVRFDESIDEGTLRSDTFLLSTDSGTVDGAITINNDKTIVTFRPTSDLEYNTDYTVTLKAGIKDVAGNSTTSDYITTFGTQISGGTLKVVYYDPAYSTAWISRTEALVYRNFLVANGFTEMNANQLKTFMENYGAGSTVVMAQDVIPDTISEIQSSEALIRRYMDEGGTVMWLQDVPLYYLGHADGTRTVWGNNGMESVLGFSNGSWNMNDSVSITDKGTESGLRQEWASIRPVQTFQVTNVLASASGGAAAWHKNYNPAYPDSGFIRLWDNSGDFTSRVHLRELIKIAGADNGGVVYPDLVGQWRMDGDWIDSSGFGNHGTAYNGATFSSDKMIGTSSASFDGVDDVSIINPYNNFPTTEITLEFWMKSSDNLNSGTPVSYAAGSSDNEFLVYNYNNISIYRGAESLNTGISVNDGMWHHVAVTWRSSDGQANLFKDGSLAYTGNFEAGRPIVSGGSLVFGQEQDGVGVGFDATQAFKGSIDEAAIYNRALPVEDVLEHYNAGVTMDRSPPAPPTVDPVDASSYNSRIMLSGTKDVGSSIRVNGVQIVAVDDLTIWEGLYSLQTLGENILDITSRDAAGNESGAVVASVTHLPPNQSDPDLAGLWHMDGNWDDLSGNNNHGTSYNGAIFNSDKKAGTSSGSFDGLDDVSIINPYNNFPTTDITLEFWMKSSDNLNSGTPVSYAVSSHNNEFLVYNYNNLGIYRGDDVLTTGVSVNDGKWHHVAVTWSSSDGQANLFKDGSLAYTGNIATGRPIVSGGSLAFGQEQDTVGGGFDTTQAFKGSIDEVAIYNRALSASEILEHYTTGITFESPPPATPMVLPVDSTTYGDTILVSGTKEEWSSVLINGEEVVSADGSAQWAISYILQPGANTLTITSGNEVGRESSPQIVEVYYNNLQQWSNRIKLAIDHTKIDGDLTDFPVRVHLSNASGSTLGDVSPVFDELGSDANRKKIAVTTADGVTQCFVEIENWDSVNREADLWVKVPNVSSTEDTVLYLYYDSTHADNDTQLPTDVVDDFTGNDGDPPNIALWNQNNTSRAIVNNTLRFAGSNVNSVTNSNFYLSGDFDIQIDYNLVQWNVPSAEWNVLRFLIRDPVTAQYWGLYRTIYPSANERHEYYVPEGNGSAITAQTSGKFRFTRASGVITLYYWSGTQWEWNGNTAGYVSSTNSTNNLYVSLNDTGEASTTNEWYYDNFKINSADSITGFVGDTGQVPAQQVWDNNFAAVYHMAQNPIVGQPVIKDSTSNMNQCTPSTSTGDIWEASDVVDYPGIGKSLDFNGASDYLSCGNMGIPLNGTATVEQMQYINILATEKKGTPTYRYMNHLNSVFYQNAFTDSLYMRDIVEENDNFPVYLQKHVWENVAVSYNGNTSTATANVNGTQYNVRVQGSAQDIQPLSNFLINQGSISGYYSYHTKMLVNEVRVSNIARSSAWLKATHYSNKDELITVLVDTTPPAVPTLDPVDENR